MLGIAVFSSPMFPLGDSLIAGMAQRHQLNFGTMRLWGSFGFALSAIAGGMLWEQIGLNMMFLFTGLALFPAAFFASRLEKGPQAMLEEQKRTSVKEIWHDTGLVLLIIASFLIGVAMQFFALFDGLYMNSLGGAPTFVGLLFGIAALCELPAMQYSVALNCYLRGPRILLLGYAALLLTFAGYLLVWQAWMLLPLAIFRGIGIGFFFVNTVRLTSERAPESLQSTVKSTVRAASFGLAPLVASPIGGELFDRYGFRAVHICACLVILAAILVLSAGLLKGIFSESSGRPSRPLRFFHRKALDYSS